MIDSSHPSICIFCGGVANGRTAGLNEWWDGICRNDWEMLEAEGRHISVAWYALRPLRLEPDDFLLIFDKANVPLRLLR